MDWPDEAENETNKLAYGLRLPGALGHIGLSTNDLVNVTLLNSRGDRTWGPFRGRRNSLQLLQFLETAVASGPTNLNISLRNYALRARRPGLLFLISDFLSPGGWREGLNALQARGYEIGLIHLFSPDEIDPPLGGDLKLVDIETGAEAEITLDPTTRDAYRARLQTLASGRPNWPATAPAATSTTSPSSPADPGKSSSCRPCVGKDWSIAP
jgi:hypothetical protein